MLPTTGYFRGVPCPDHEKGLCARPFCHFRHNPKTDFGGSKDSHAETSSVVEAADEPFEKQVLDEPHKSEEDAAEDSNHHDISPLDGSKSAILQQLVSEAVQKIITENPILAGIDPSTLIHKLDTKTLISDANSQIHNPEDRGGAHLGSGTSTNTEQEVAPGCSTPKKQRLYLPPPGTPRYDPTPISELKKRKSSNPENDQEETSNEAKRLKANEDSDCSDFSSEDEDALKRKSEFDILEEVLAEHSMSRKKSLRKKRKNAIAQLEYNISKKQNDNVNEDEMIADARTGKNEENKNSSPSGSRAPEVDDWEPVNSFLPPSPVFTSSSDVCSDFSSLHYVSSSSANQTVTGESSGRATHQKLQATASQNGPKDKMKHCPSHLSESPKITLSTVEAPSGKEKVQNLSESTATSRKSKFSGPKLLRREFPSSLPKLIRPNIKAWNSQAQIPSGPNINTENLEALLQDSDRDRKYNHSQDLNKDKVSSSKDVCDTGRQIKSHAVSSESGASQQNVDDEGSAHRNVREKVDLDSLKNIEEGVSTCCPQSVEEESCSASSKCVREERGSDLSDIKEERKGACLKYHKKEKDSADSRNIGEKNSVNPKIAKQGEDGGCTSNSKGDVNDGIPKRNKENESITSPRGALNVAKPDNSHKEKRMAGGKKTFHKGGSSESGSDREGARKVPSKSECEEDSYTESEPETLKHCKQSRKNADEKTGDKENEKSARESKTGRVSSMDKKERKEGYESQAYEESKEETDLDLSSSEETRKRKKRRRRRRSRSSESRDSSDSYYAQKKRRQRRKRRKKHSRKKRRRKGGRSESDYSSSESDSEDEETSSEEESDDTGKGKKHRKKSRHHRKSRRKSRKGKSKYKKKKRRRSHSTSSSSSSSSSYKKRKKRKRKELQRHSSDSESGSSNMDDKASKANSKHSIEMPISPSQIKVEEPDLSIVKVEKVDPGYEIHEKVDGSGTSKSCDSLKEKHHNKSKEENRSEKWNSKEKNCHDIPKTDGKQISSEKNSRDKSKTDETKIPKDKNSHVESKAENIQVSKHSDRVHCHRSHTKGEPGNVHHSTSHHRTREEKYSAGEKHYRENTKDKRSHRSERTSSQDDKKRSYTEDRKECGKKQGGAKVQSKEESKYSSKRQEVDSSSHDSSKKKISDEERDNLDSIVLDKNTSKASHHSNRHSNNKTKVKKEHEVASESSHTSSSRRASGEDKDNDAMSLFDSLMMSMGGPNQKGTTQSRKISSSSQDKVNTKHESRASDKHRKHSGSVSTKAKDEVLKEDRNSKMNDEKRKERRNSSSRKSSDKQHKSSKKNMDVGGDSPDLSALDLIPQEDWDLLLQECKEEPDEKKSDSEAPPLDMEYESDNKNDDDEGFDCSHDEEEIEESLKKSKAYQKLLNELAEGRRRLKELEEQQKKLEVKEASSSFAAVALRSGKSEQGNVARRRVAGVPNVASLLHAREKIKSLPPTSSRSLLNPKVALPSGVLPLSTYASSSKAGSIASGMIGQGKALASNRTTLSVKEEMQNRPSIPVEIGSKIPQNIRQRYLNAFIEECLKFCSAAEDAYNIAVAEEQVCFQRGTNRMIYLNVAVNTVKRLRLEQISEGALEILEEDPEVASSMCSSRPAVASQSSVPSKFPVTSAKKRVARTNSSSASSTSTSVCGQSSIQRKESHFGVLAGGGMKGSWSVPATSKSSSASVSSEYEGVAFYRHLKKYILSEEEMEENGFPCPDLSVKGKARIIKVNPRKKISPSPLKRYCARCSTLYTVDDLGFPTTLLSCVYHWGRLLKRSGMSNSDAEYTCCHSRPHSEGCCQAITHVSDNFNPEELHGFVRTIPKDPGPDGNYGVFALDCETCFTTGGRELVKVSVISDAGNVVYETLVRPDNPVLDYNTRFSGLTEDDLDGIKTTIRDVQNVLLSRFSGKTILIGHGLESDLCTLKLIHKTIIDTSLVFPHKKGPPHKRALSHLAAEYLRRIVEEGEDGHETADDALACLDLMKWKVKEDLKCKVKK